MFAPKISQPWWDPYCDDLDNKRFLYISSTQDREWKPIHLSIEDRISVLKPRDYAPWKRSMIFLYIVDGAKMIRIKNSHQIIKNMSEIQDGTRIFVSIPEKFDF